MGRMLRLALVCVITTCLAAETLVNISHAQQADLRKFLKVHNNARRKIGLPPLVWNQTLAEFARAYATKSATADCSKMIHSNGPYGENIFWGGGSRNWDAKFAVRAWNGEKKHYDYKTNSCRAGQMCGHYTQMVWKDTKSVGCARASCNGGAGQLIICNYYPPGNWRGEKPY